MTFGEYRKMVSEVPEEFDSYTIVKTADSYPPSDYTVDNICKIILIWLEKIIMIPALRQ